MKGLTISVAARRALVYLCTCALVYLCTCALVYLCTCALVYLCQIATFCLTHYTKQISQRSASCPAGQKFAVIFGTK